MSQSVNDTVVGFDIAKGDLRAILTWLGALPNESWWVEKDVVGRIIGVSFKNVEDAVVFRLTFGVTNNE